VGVLLPPDVAELDLLEVHLDPGVRLEDEGRGVIHGRQLEQIAYRYDLHATHWKSVVQWSTIDLRPAAPPRDVIQEVEEL